MRILSDKLPLRVAAGVSWSLHGSQSEARKEARKGSLVVVRKEREFVVGCIQQSVKSAAGIYAGALLLAQVEKDAILYEELGDGEAWLVAVRDGMPLPGFDIVADTATVQAQFSEALHYNPSASIYGSIDGAKATLIDALDKLQKRDIALTRMHRPAALKRRVLAALALVLCVAAAGGAFYLQQERLVEEQSALQKLMDVQITERSKLQRRAELADSFKKSIELRKRELHETVSPEAQFAAWVEFARKMPLSIDGWRVMDLDCDPARCLISWAASEGTMPHSAVKLPGATKNTVLQGNTMANAIKTEIAIPLVRNKATREQLLSPQMFVVALGALYKSSGLVAQAGPATDLIQVTPPAGLEGVNPAVVGKKGVITISGRGLVNIGLAVEKLGHPNVVLSRIRLANFGVTAMSALTTTLDGYYLEFAE